MRLLINQHLWLLSFVPWRIGIWYTIVKLSQRYVRQEREAKRAKLRESNAEAYIQQDGGDGPASKAISSASQVIPQQMCSKGLLRGPSSPCAEACVTLPKCRQSLVKL